MSIADMNGFANMETGNLNTVDAIRSAVDLSGSADIVKTHMNIPVQQRRSVRERLGGHTAEL